MRCKRAWTLPLLVFIIVCILAHTLKEASDLQHQEQHFSRPPATSQVGKNSEFTIYSTTIFDFGVAGIARQQVLARDRVPFNATIVKLGVPTLSEGSAVPLSMASKEDESGTIDRKTKVDPPTDVINVSLAAVPTDVPTSTVAPANSTAPLPPKIYRGKPPRTIAAWKLGYVRVNGKKIVIPFGTLEGTETGGAPIANFTGVDPTPPGCPARYYTFVNNFGGHNNQLITLLNALELCKHNNYTLAVPPFIDIERRRLIKPAKLYEFTRFLQSGYCFVFYYHPEMGPLRKGAAFHLFRTLPSMSSRPYHLLGPSKIIKDQVDWMVSQRLPPNFTAVHRRTDMRGFFLCHVAEELKPPFCHMHIDFIRKAQRETGHNTDVTFFVGTDQPAARLQGGKYTRYTGSLSHSHTQSAVVDMFIFTRASLFLGNPSSSLSLNACNIRRTMNPPLQCYNFSYCYEREGYIVNWPCGSPVQGISDQL